MDELLVAGLLHTLDPARPRAEAALIRGGRFAVVGSRDACARAAGPSARLVELGEGCATPGLADAHGHLLHLGRALVEVDLSGARSEAACVARVAERARETPAGNWIRGGNWDQTLWPEARFPTLDALSRAVPDHPVALSRVDVHALWVNARALEECGISRATQDPPGGRILRRDGGAPAGVLIDNAGDLVSSRIPRPRPAETEALVLRAARAVALLGITSVHDACVGPELGEVLRGLAARDALPLRVSAMLDGQVTTSDAQLDDQMARWSGAPAVGLLTVPAVKLFADGALGSRGAALLEPYEDDAGNTGLFITPPDVLRERILRVARKGFSPAVHAIGDAACRAVLRAFVEVARAGLAGVRPRVEHLQILRPEDAPLLRASGAVASMQPVHATSDGRWAEERLGRGTPRQRGAYAWRQAKEAGAVLAFGSDFPVEGADPLQGIYSAVARRLAGAAPDAPAWMPEQRLDRPEALHAFTAGAAYAERAENRRGRIQAGYDADLTLFGRDLLGVPEAEIPRVPIAGTVVAGRLQERG
ncbi:MAG: amidohydrolase [Myxococcales bacterium]